ncbi:hypothetical protein B0H67DRAFT_206201 [Lasiosphaeris hirsuta]|uniref:Cell wall biogenesis protein Mhp1 n=1 Tax=Lasiosphaeris hirsuta TaxID=260670 RepID=A0AA40ARX1_9PEZI|nr:hypothetical protein B0H67DRAFT_206201 [Lasiosphaeris hirsuta]
MEQIHGVDVSWMTHGNPKDKGTKVVTRSRSISQGARDILTPAAISSTGSPPPPTTTVINGNQIGPAISNGTGAQPAKQATPARPVLARAASSDEKRSAASPQRRGSWFSNISSKFSSGNTASQSPPQANTAQPKPAELSVPRPAQVKNAVLQHASKHEGEGPYTPAPPRSSQAGILHVFRRLSSSNGNLGTVVKPHNHGLVERRVLNVDQHRERCEISGLRQAKLRRVAFCVDVEIAPMPKYEQDSGQKCPVKAADQLNARDKDQKRKIKEKGEGEALKNTKARGAQEEEDIQNEAAGDVTAQEPAKEYADADSETTTTLQQELSSEKPPDKQPTADNKKKDKKKKSEEERKARKEKRRKLAEANGTIPMELYLDSDSSTSTVPPPETPRIQAVPTTNPVRIYRRCCQLRETPILKKITEQLADPANSSTEPGMIERLDLSGYWMQLPDLVTLGDYLAVVPIREVLLDNCGLSDEGLRVILAGLLAARKASPRKRKPVSEPDGLTKQGGVVERLVLKNNKLGPEGWRHICLFIYLSHTLKSLDLSHIPFPRPTVQNGGSYGIRADQDFCRLLSKSLGERIGGPTLSLLSLGQTGLNTEQLGAVIDGAIKCSVRRLGLADNDIDPKGLDHVARYLSSGVCEGLDLGGNDLREQLAVIANALQVDNCPLWALSLADCNLKPGSLCKLLPKLCKLPGFRFIDLSHNQDLFSMEPSAITVLRRYLPKMECLKRIHLADCSLSPEQAIALAEILPEIPGLAHVSFLENPEIVELATNATTDEAKEEACALFASLLAAVRVSSNLVAVDIEPPSEQSSDLVKAMAKQVVAVCLYNMELAALTAAQSAEATLGKEPEYPDVLQRLVGHDVTLPADFDSDLDAAPDDDYVIGGTGVVKALACCLKNRGDESRRQSGEFIRDVENGVMSQPRIGLPSGKAKETSKHLLLSARKIRHRLQPAIRKAKATNSQDTHAYHRLMFLDSTLQGVIKRFEDEFPDTREAADSAISLSSSDEANDKQLSASLSSTELGRRTSMVLSDGEDEVDAEVDTDVKIRPSSLVRSNSTISLTSRALAEEEGRVLRAGHQFRRAIVKPEQYASLLEGVEMVGADPKHVRLLHELLEDLGDEGFKQEAKEVGIVNVFQHHRKEIWEKLRECNNPMEWDRFVESQEMARANVNLEGGEGRRTSEGELEAE